MYFTFTFALFLTVTYAQVNPLAVGQVVHGNVGLDRWTYYNFSVPANVGWSLQVVHAVGVNGHHDIDIYVRKEALPDRGRYDYTDLSLKSEITITGVTLSTPTFYILGIFGFRGSNTPYTVFLQLNNGCPQNCNNHGTCVSAQCSCFIGYTGLYCESKTEVITLGTNYKRSINATQWLFFTVEIFTANNLNIYVNQKSGLVDLFIQWENEPTRFSYQYASYGYVNTQYSISITEPHLGTWYLGFYSIFGAEFSFNVTEARTCPMKCSKHGNCVGTSCRCSSSYTGLSCEEFRTYSSMDYNYGGFVDQNYWNYYKFAADSGNPVDIMLNHSLNADCDLFVCAYSKPTQLVYDYLNISFNVLSDVIIQNPGFTTWWIGIYGVTACDYQLKIKFLTGKDCDCVNGQCVEGLCRCSPGFVGQTCNHIATILTNGVAIPSTSISNNQWIYYQINVTASSQLNLVLQEKSTSGMVWLYVARETSPTLTDYYATDSDSGLSTHRLSLEFSFPQTHTFIIGAYGSPFIGQSVNFTLVAWYTPF